MLANRNCHTLQPVLCKYQYFKDIVCAQMPCLLRQERGVRRQELGSRREETSCDRSSAEMTASRVDRGGGGENERAARARWRLVLFNNHQTAVGFPPTFLNKDMLFSDPHLRPRPTEAGMTDPDQPPAQPHPAL